MATARAASVRRLDSESKSALMILAPVIAFFAVFQYYPILKSIWISFLEYGLLRRDTPFVGLSNYIRQFQDPLFMSALGNTAIFVIFAVVFGVVLALFFGVLVESTGRLASFYRTLYFVPVVTSLLATSMIFTWLYASNGLINFILTYFGFAPKAWLLSESLALPSLIALTVWKNLGFDLVLISAAIQAIPDNYYEVSKIDGATPWQNFWYVTLPQLRPIVLLVTITAVIRSFQVFTVVLAMTQGGPINSTRTIVYHIYEQGIQYDEMGYASAAAVILLAMIGALTYIQMRLGRESA